MNKTELYNTIYGDKYFCSKHNIEKQINPLIIEKNLCYDCTCKSDLSIIAKSKSIKGNWKMNKRELFVSIYGDMKFCSRHIKHISGEIWKILHDSYNSSKYQISNYGRLKNINSSYVHKGTIDEEKYLYFTILTDDQIQKRISAHILVAKTFINNPGNLPEVDHINRNRSNNHVSNLRWSTIKDNRNNRDTPKSVLKLRRIINQFDLNGNLIKKWGSITSVANFYNIDGSAISKVCRDKRKTYKGFIWKYNEIENIEDEIWKDVSLNTKYKYQVSNKGRVKNLDDNKLLNGSVNKGYKKVGLTMSNDKVKKFGIHKLVTEMFKGSIPKNKDVVDHIDENKLNNSLDNLEYVTHSENTTRKLGKEVYQYNKKMEFIGKYPSIAEASRITGTINVHISRVCHMKRKSANGYIWSFTPLTILDKSSYVSASLPKKVYQYNKR